MSPLDFLYTPFPRPKKSKRNLLWLTLVGMGSSLFILLYKPFGISSPEDPWYVDLIVLSLGLLFILTILFFEWLIPSIFPRFFQKWNLGKAIIWYSIVILFIGAVNFFYKSYLGGFADFTWIEFFNVLGRVMVIAVTVSFFILGIWNYLNQRKLSMTTLNEEYVVSSQTGQTLRLKLADILYITSDDNYVDIHYLKNGARKKTLFRSSLKNVESQIVHRLSPIRRCHRQFLINTRHFTLDNTSKRAMTIRLNDYDDVVPVSKKYAAAIGKDLHTRP